MISHRSIVCSLLLFASQMKREQFGAAKLGRELWVFATNLKALSPPFKVFKSRLGSEGTGVGKTPRR
jgi:hypothetical protein